MAKGLRFIVVPATNTIFKQAIERGYIKTFIEAGAVICHPCCGLCCGMPYGLMTDDERILLTANRNFIGRQGTKKTLGYLSSPTVAAATAVMGVVTDPADLQHWLKDRRVDVLPDSGRTSVNRRKINDKEF